MRRLFAILFLVCALAAGFLGWSGSHSSVPETRFAVAAVPKPVVPTPIVSTTQSVPAPVVIAPVLHPLVAPPSASVSRPALIVPLAGDRYAEAEVLEHEGGVDVTKPGPYRQARLIRVSGEKYPLLVVRDEVEVSPEGKARLIKQQVMVADHVLLKPKPGVTDATLLAAIQKLGGTVRKKMPASRIWLIAFSKPTLTTVTKALQDLSALPDVTAMVEPDYIVHASVAAPSDPSFTTLWGLHNTGQNGGLADADIDALEAWDTTTGSRSVLVGVIDTGIDQTHPDLVANLWTNPNEIAANNVDDDNNGYVDDVHGWDFANNDNNPDDDHLHGTHCAGTIGAAGNNGQGVVGVCWQVSLVGLKFLNGDGSGATSDAVEAIAYATSIGVDVTSNSWGGGGYSSLMKSVIDTAGAAGILFIAAAGNESTNSDSEVNYPSGYDSANIIAVAATTRSDVLSYYSNYGATTVDLAAPGSEIYSTAPGGGYATLSGTSMATPHVAGACALLLAQNPTLTPAAVKAALLGAVDPLTALAGRCVSGGRLNVQRALQRSSELAVEPLAGFAFSQPLGGSGAGAGQSLQLTNHSINNVGWSVEFDQPWVTLDGATTGTLAAGASIDLKVNLVAEELALLPGGLHSAVLTVTNLSTGRTHLLGIRLDLVPPAVADFSLDTDPGWPRTSPWAYGTPTGGGGRAHGLPDPTRGATGTQVLGINLAGDYSTAVGGPYWLTAGPFDLSQRKSTRLSFQRWLNSDYEPWVSAMIEVSTNGRDWTRVWRNGSTFITDSSWRKMELDLSAIADRRATVWVRWGHQVGRSTDVWACSGWNLDDIQILGQLDRALTLAGPVETTEGEAEQTFTLQLHPVPTEPTTVALSASAADQLSLPGSVTFAAGQGSVTFAVQAVDDALSDGTQTVNLVATLDGWPAGQRKVEVHDNESSALVLTLPDEVQEGSINVFGTVSLAVPAERALKVALSSANKTAVNVPSSVTIAAGQDSATFPLIIVDDAFINSAQTVTITASVTNWPTATSTTAFVDDEPHELIVELPEHLQENLAATFTGTVRVPGVLIEPLTVSLISADILRLTVPESVTIPAGASGQTFYLTPGDDTVTDGLQQVRITARAKGFKSGTGTANIYDNESPALPGNPSPVDGQERTAPNAKLTWGDVPYTGSTPTTWDIYFGTTREQAMTRKVGSMNRRQWSLGRTQRGTTYYWRVVARRGRAAHAGPVWSFTIPSTGLPVRVVWNKLASTQLLNKPFAIGFTAYDEFGNLATLSGPPIQLSEQGASLVVLEPGTQASPVQGRWKGTARFPYLAGMGLRMSARLADGQDAGASMPFQISGLSADPPDFRPFYPQTVREAASGSTARLLLIPRHYRTLPTVFTLRSMDTSEILSGTVSVTGVGGYADFELPVLDDDLVDGPQTIRIEAWAPNHSSAYTTVTVLDNEANPLTLILPASFSEGAGIITGTVTVPHAPVNDVMVALKPDFTPALLTSFTVPAEVKLSAGQTSVSFPITVKQNSVLDFDRTARITAEVPGWDTDTGSTLVIDDEARTITVSLQPSLSEGAVKVTGLIGVGAPLLSKLTLNLSASDTSELTVPAQVSIPAGQSYASFDVATIDDSELDGSQSVDITISAPGLTTKVQPFIVRDNDAHHFTFSPLPDTLQVGVFQGVTISAKDVNDEPLVLVRGPVTLTTSSGSGPIACTPTTLVESSGIVSGLLSVRVLAPGAGVRLKATGPQGTGESTAFTVVRGPQAEITPSSLSLRVPANSAKTRVVTVRNTGTHDLNWSASALGFLQVFPASGILAPGATATLNVTASAVGFPAGSTQNGQVIITTNDGLQNRVEVPVNMQSVTPIAAFRWGTIAAQQQVNAPFTVQLTAIDAAGNTVTDYDGTASLSTTTTGLSAVTPAQTSSFINGVWQGPIAITRVLSSVQVQATDQTVQSTSAAFAVSAIGTATLVLRSDLREGQGTVADAATLTINAALDRDMVFTLASFDTTTLTVPATVTLPAGQTQVTFAVTVEDNDRLEGPQPVALIFSGPGLAQVRQSVIIQDNETSALHLTLSTEFTEGQADETVTIDLDQQPDADFVIVFSTTSARFTLPASVTIPSGAASTTFTLSMPDNLLLDGDETVTLRASSPGLSPWSGQVQMRDNEARTLLLDGLPTTFSEVSTGPFYGSVQLSGRLPAPLTVTLESSDPAQVLSQEVTMPQGTSSVVFSIRPIDNALYEGRRSITLTAKAETFSSSTPRSIVITDNDTHHFDILAIPSPQIRNTPVSIQVIARDVHGESISLPRMPEFFFAQAAEVLAHRVVSAPALFDGVIRAQFAVDGLASAARLHVRDPQLGAESSSNAFALTHGTASSIEWNMGTTTPVAGQPFAVTLTARDVGGNVVTDFTSSAIIGLAPPDTVAIGSGAAYTLWSPLGSSFAATRSQILYTAAELGNLATLGSMTLDVTSKPALKLNNYTLRVKPTDRTTYTSSDSFDATDWTTVFTGTLDLTAIGPRTFPFSQRYMLDKTKNLLVDLSFQNTSGGAYNGSVRAHSLSTNHLLLSTGSSTPFDFMQGVGNHFRPHTTFSSGTPAVTITPGQGGAFAQGVWTGTLTITPAAKAVKLQATSGPVTGTSPLIDVLAAP